MEAFVRFRFSSLILLLSFPLLSGCVTLATSAVSTGTVVVAQERSVGDAVDDFTIYTQIQHHFLQKDIKHLFIEVLVKVIEGRVMLAGEVQQPETAIEAVRLTWQVPGVREVINEIQVRDKSSIIDYADDVWISTQVRSRLLLAKDVLSINYNVMTVNGVIYLLGIAQDQTELEKALYICRTTKGVKQVVNHVVLKTDPRRVKESTAQTN